MKGFNPRTGRRSRLRQAQQGVKVTPSATGHATNDPATVEEGTASTCKNHFLSLLISKGQWLKQTYIWEEDLSVYKRIEGKRFW